MEKLIIVANKRWLAPKLEEVNEPREAFKVLRTIDVLDLLNEIPEMFQLAFGDLLPDEEFLKDALCSIC